MDIDAIQLESIAIVELLSSEDSSGFSDLENQLIDKLRTKCMENVVFISAIRRLRKKFPVASLATELYLEGVS
jgi:hypothetical protein